MVRSLTRTHALALTLALALPLVLAPTACGGDDEGSGTPGGAGGSGGGGTGGAGGTSLDGAGDGWATGGTGGDASIEAGCSASTCTQPGYACLAGACVEDCRLPKANACELPKVCDVGSEHTGKCVTPGVGCVITSQPVSCAGAGDSQVTCGPGTRCDGGSGCYAALPCKAMKCDEGTCWGTECSCTRPAAPCAPAALGKPGDVGTLNDYEFTKCGSLSSCDGGIFDLDFDQKCNAYGVTMLSGTDYLRKIDPQGKVTEVGGVTNLNMGEVAAIQGKSGLFGGGLEDVALTYICCATCGCILSGSGGNPQGVAALDPTSATLPMKIPTTKYSSGAGPFGTATVDTGPYGLTWGLDRVLYVGNVDANGDYHSLDLDTQTKKLVATFPKRVLASAPFDAAHMIVGLEGGEVVLAPVAGGGGSPKTLLVLSTHMTSLVRDPWSGRVYAELGNKTIVSFAEDGSDLSAVQNTPGLGRITIAPDGYLYHLTVGFLGPVEIVRWPLPTSL